MKEESYRQRYDVWREELARAPPKGKAEPPTPTLFAVTALTIEAIDGYSDVRRVAEVVRKGQKPSEGTDEGGALHYNAIRAEFNFAKNKDRISIYLDEQLNVGRAPATRLRFEVYLVAAKYAQLLVQGNRLVIEVSRAFVIREKPSEQLRIENFLFARNPLPGVSRWAFDLQFDSDCFEAVREQIKRVNDVLREIGMRVVEEEIPIRELAAKQEIDFAKQDEELRKLSLQQKIRAATALPYPRLSKRAELGLRCPIYSCFEAVQSADELRAHILRHTELRPLQLKVTADGCIQFPDEMLNHLLLFEHFFKDFVQKKVIQPGNTRLK